MCVRFHIAGCCMGCWAAGLASVQSRTRLGFTMYLFLIFLVFGFVCNLASAFTAVFCQRWGERQGSLVSVLLRDILGIPVWALGFVLAARTSSPSLFASSLMAVAIGWGLILSGGIIIVMALISIRIRAARPSQKDRLVETGLYSCVRHPIHCGTLLEFAGLLLLIPTVAMACACALGIIWILAQSRVEECDLRQRIPEYSDYMKRVPRFLPRIWRK